MTERTDAQDAANALEATAHVELARLKDPTLLAIQEGIKGLKDWALDVNKCVLEMETGIAELKLDRDAQGRLIATGAGTADKTLSMVQEVARQSDVAKVKVNFLQDALLTVMGQAGEAKGMAQASMSQGTPQASWLQALLALFSKVTAGALGWLVLVAMLIYGGVTVYGMYLKAPPVATVTLPLPAQPTVLPGGAPVHVEIIQPDSKPVPVKAQTK